jgi:hypothetical protein
MDKKDLAQDKKMIKAAVGKHEKNMHPGKTPTKLRAGGKTNSEMLKYGRIMAKIMNQRCVGRGG